MRRLCWAAMLALATAGTAVADESHEGKGLSHDVAAAPGELAPTGLDIAPGGLGSVPYGDPSAVGAPAGVGAGERIRENLIGGAHGDVEEPPGSPVGEMPPRRHHEKHR